MCCELSAAGIADGKTVALIDLDAQGSLARWWNRRTKGTNGKEVNPDLLQVPADQIPAAANKLRAKYDLIVIDSPPSVHETIRAVAAVADLAVIPARPTIHDLDATGPMVRLLHGLVDFVFVLTQVPGARSRDGAEAFELLAGRAPVIGRATFRLDYSRPPATGSTGFESGEVARQEVGVIYGRVLERLALNAQSAVAITS
jgi:chromosome partitioning protein